MVIEIPHLVNPFVERSVVEHQPPEVVPDHADTGVSVRFEAEDVCVVDLVVGQGRMGLQQLVEDLGHLVI